MQFISLLVLITLLLVACGGSSATTHKTAKKTSLTLLAQQQGAYPRNFNPYNPSVISGTQGMIYETLLAYNRLDGSVKPWLAESYSMASDAKSITFHLRQNILWSDGQPFTSDDVVFTVNLLRKYSAMDLEGVGSFVKHIPDT